MSDSRDQHPNLFTMPAGSASRGPEPVTKATAVAEATALPVTVVEPVAVLEEARQSEPVEGRSHRDRAGGFAGSRRRLLSLRRIVRLADRAAESPDWWRTLRLHFFHPDWSHKEIADLLGIPRPNVTRYLRDVLIDDDVYADLPPEKP